MSEHVPTDRAEAVRCLFDELVEVGPEERAERLRNVSDRAVRWEVAALLEAHGEAGERIGALDELHALLAPREGASPGAEPDQHARPDPLDLEGARVRQYQITKHLGGGGMGVVYKARDTKLDRPVALKFLPPHLTTSREAKERLIREAKAASALDHPNICTIHDIGETDEGRLFIVMAHYEGETLKKKIAREPLPVAEALDYVIQIAQGLEKAHAAGIVHRDVKPANVLVTADHVVKILDFGIAKVAGVNLTRTGATPGTVAYMSPEQARGEAVDARVDLWSLGVVLYEMLTGRRPFSGDHEQAVIYSILNEAPEPIRALQPELPAASEAVVRKLLQKDREDRYQRAEDVLRDLRSIQRGGEAAHAATPVLDRILSRRRVLTLGGVALLLAVSVLLGRLLPAGGDASITSLAVLPIADHSGNPDKEYFAAGMHEALIGELAQIDALRVISRTSAMRYQDSDKSVPEIARELNVDAVVEASLVSAGERVRIQVRLIQALPQEQHRWAQVYDRDMQDVLALHSDVARAIAQEINVTLTPEEEARLADTRRVNPQAYEAYLKGRFYLYKLSPAHYETALQYFESALKLDSSYAPAYAGIADVWGHLDQWGGVLPREAHEKLEAALTNALALDSTLAHAYVVLGTENYCYEWDWDASEAALKKAIELNPNHAEARLFYGDFLLSMKRPEEAVAQMKRALELDPLNPFSHTMLGWALFATRQYDEAIVQLQKALEAEPSISLALRCLWSIYYLKGMQDEALETAKRFYRAQDREEVVEDLAQGYDVGGYEAAYRVAADRLADRARRAYVPAMRIARLYTFAGDSEAALDHLEKAYEERFASMFSLNVDPHWDRLRDHPRFQALLEKMELDA